MCACLSCLPMNQVGCYIIMQDLTWILFCSENFGKKTDKEVQQTCTLAFARKSCSFLNRLLHSSQVHHLLESSNHALKRGGDKNTTRKCHCMPHQRSSNSAQEQGFVVLLQNKCLCLFPCQLKNKWILLLSTDETFWLHALVFSKPELVEVMIKEYLVNLISCYLFERTFWMVGYVEYLLTRLKQIQTDRKSVV